MASQTLRKRVRHDDVDGKTHDYVYIERLDSLNEPLLGNFSYDNNDTVGYNSRSQQDIWDDKKKEGFHWSFLFTQLVTQWAQWLESIIVGSGSLVGRLLSLPFTLQKTSSISPLQVFDDWVMKQSSSRYTFSLDVGIKLAVGDLRNLLDGYSKLINYTWNLPLQFLFPCRNAGSAFILRMAHRNEERLRILRQRLKVSYDGSLVDHQYSLKELWQLAYPNREEPPLKSELWKEMGWQGTDPSTDFRGGGFISLENLIFFAKNYPESFQILLHKLEGQRSEWEYPFAVAGINISFMLIQMLDLQSGGPTSLAGVRFLECLAQDEMAFDNLYCVAFKLMDAQWLAKRASYMEFNDVLKSTRTQLERELALEDVTCVKDLPSYNMLNS